MREWIYVGQFIACTTGKKGCTPLDFVPKIIKELIKENTNWCEDQETNKQPKMASIQKKLKEWDVKIPTGTPMDEVFNIYQQEAIKNVRRRD